MSLINVVVKYDETPSGKKCWFVGDESLSVYTQYATKPTKKEIRGTRKFLYMWKNALKEITK